MALSYKKDLLAVVIPMFNEEQGALRCVTAVIKVLRNLPVRSMLIVVDDGSTDKTGKLLKSKATQYKKFLTLITHKKNQGYGTATQTGIDTARKKKATWVLHMDSDLTNDPKYITLFTTFMNTDYDCIKGSRYIPQGKVQNVPVYRRAISFVGNSIASVFFNIGIRDCTNGFRMVRLKKLRGIRFKENDFSIILEELYYLKRNNAKFTEIPYVLTARADSRSHFIYKPKIFLNYFKYAFKSAFSF